MFHISRLTFDTFDINEWTKSVSVEFGLEASAVVHRIAVPQGYYDVGEDTTVRMEVIPSDLIRLAGDIMSRSDKPITIQRCLEPNTVFDDCPASRQLVFELTSDGLMQFGTDGKFSPVKFISLLRDLRILKKDQNFRPSTSVILLLKRALPVLELRALLFR